MRDRQFRSSPYLLLSLACLTVVGWVSHAQWREAIANRLTTENSAPSTHPFRPNSSSSHPSPMDVSPADRAAIRQVIEQQLQAFQADDAERAFAFASPTIQAQFETAENFIDMVEAAYQPVYRSRSVMFEDIVNVDGEVAQPVILMGPDGSLFNAFYLMQKQPNESWRIHGCFLTALQGQSI